MPRCRIKKSFAEFLRNPCTSTRIKIYITSVITRFITVRS